MKETSETNLLKRMAILVPLWAAVVVGLIVLIAALPARATKWDYSIYYSSGLAMREGMNPYTTDLTRLARPLGFELDKINHATDPPTFIMCFVPLTLLSPKIGFYIWTAINGIAFLASLVLLFRWTTGLGRDDVLAVAALAILFPPVTDHLIWGQNKMLVLLMFVLMLRWLERGRDAAAGLMLALATLLRAFPLLLVGYLVLMRRWRAVAYTGIGLLFGGLITLALAGVNSTLSFVLAPTYLTEQWREALPGNIALGPTLTRMSWYFFGAHPAAQVVWAANACHWIVAIALVAIAVKATIARSANGDPDGRLFCLWMLTAVIVSPTSWFYYLVLLALPMVKLSAAAANNRTSARALWTGVACYTAAWLYFAGIDMHSHELVLHPDTLVWRAGASPVVLLAYASVYWFATDNGVEEPAERSAMAHSIPTLSEPNRVRTAI